MHTITDRPFIAKLERLFYTVIYSTLFASHEHNNYYGKLLYKWRDIMLSIAKFVKQSLELYLLYSNNKGTFIK